MIFKLMHDKSWPNHKGEVFGIEKVCSMTGCTFYLDLRDDVKEWFRETGIAYKIQGVDPWGEPICGEPFDLVIPDDAHALIFKLRWL